jgi:hypothetical protein
MRANAQVRPTHLVIHILTLFQTILDSCWPSAHPDRSDLINMATSCGMGADNLLEATIVTPNGRFLLANPCVNSDLFPAIRGGGGGGTFGVVRRS